MIFASEKAREFLLKNGDVYSFRVKRHNVGRDWVTDRRGGKKIADIYIVEVGQTKPSLLQDFVSRSGFSSLPEWIQEIKKLNKEHKEDVEGWLYHVNVTIRK